MRPGDENWHSAVGEPVVVAGPESVDWDRQADVLVIGFGGGGATRCLDRHPGTLRIIACIENPDVIATILEHIRVREAATTANPRAPPLNTGLPAARHQDRLP